MKKSLVIFSFLFLTSICFLFFLNFSLLASKDNITFEENLIYGDKEMADGMTIHVGSVYARQLFWDTTYKTGPNSSVSTDYTFYQKGQVSSFDSVDTFLLDTDLPTYDFHPESPREEQPGILKKAYDIFHSPSYSPEQEKSKQQTIFLKEYYDYYPFTYTIRIGNYEEYYGFAIDDNIYGEKDEDYEALTNFFKIPVPKDDARSLWVEKYNYGGNKYASADIMLNSIEYSENAKSYYFNNHCVVTDDSIYYTFHYFTDQGPEAFDDSYIPGGYGIYRIPYETTTKNGVIKQDPDFQNIDMVYPLEQKTEIFCFTKTLDESKLLLAYRDKNTPDSSTEIAVLDAATLKTLQKITLKGVIQPDGSTEVPIPYSFYIYDDFIAVLCSSKYLAVMPMTDSGLYRLAYMTDIHQNPVFDYHFMDPGRTVMDLKDDKIAVVSHISRTIGDFVLAESCGFYIGIFDKTGLIYYSEHASSLDKGETTYGNMVQPLSFYNFDENEHSLTLNWE